MFYDRSIEDPNSISIHACRWDPQIDLRCYSPETRHSQPNSPLCIQKHKITSTFFFLLQILFVYWYSTYHKGLHCVPFRFWINLHKDGTTCSAHWATRHTTTYIQPTRVYDERVTMKAEEKRDEKESNSKRRIVREFSPSASGIVINVLNIITEEKSPTRKSGSDDVTGTFNVEEINLVNLRKRRSLLLNRQTFRLHELSNERLIVFVCETWTRWSTKIDLAFTVVLLNYILPTNIVKVLRLWAFAYK